METNETRARSVAEIGEEIRRVWKNPYFGAVPYIGALCAIESLDTPYGHDNPRGIVRYFLCNASRWRGPDAKRLKAELKKAAGV